MRISSADPVGGGFGPARVRASHPAGPVWPSNLLRLHLVFDRPMDVYGATAHVRLSDAAGRPIEGAFLDLPDGLWTADQRVLTLLLHPGRVKTGLAAGDRYGPVLERGTTVRLSVDSGLRDAWGRPGAGFVREIRVGPPLDGPVGTESWRLTGTDPGTRRPALLHVDRPIDVLSAEAGFAVRDGVDPAPVALHAVPGPAPDLFVVEPLAPWPAPCRDGPGRPVPVAMPWLEDVAGNRADVSFETDLRNAVRLPH